MYLGAADDPTPEVLSRSLLPRANSTQAGSGHHLWIGDYSDKPHDS